MRVCHQFCGREFAEDGEQVQVRDTLLLPVAVQLFMHGLEAIGLVHVGEGYHQQLPASADFRQVLKRQQPDLFDFPQRSPVGGFHLVKILLHVEFRWSCQR